MYDTRAHVVIDVVIDLLVVAAVVIAAALWAPPRPSGRDDTGDAAGAPSESAVRAAIARLPVAAPGAAAPYERTQFPHWIEIAPDCDTRCVVLDRQRSPGGWLSVYDGYVATTPAELQIDHTVPLAEAWVSGAAAWTLATRQAFANDLDSGELLAVSAWSNGDKGASDPALWRPPDPGWWCRYADAWVGVKLRWGLTADPAEVAALDDMARSC